jgi:DNA-binding NtrC family response regulator
LSRGPVIRIGDLPSEIRLHQAIEQEGSLANRMEAVEREMMISALEKHDWIQTRAAETLGISERMLRYKMNKYRIKNQKKR